MQHELSCRATHATLLTCIVLHDAYHCAEQEQCEVVRQPQHVDTTLLTLLETSCEFQNSKRGRCRQRCVHTMRSHASAEATALHTQLYAVYNRVNGVSGNKCMQRVQLRCSRPSAAAAMGSITRSSSSSSCPLPTTPSPCCHARCSHDCMPLLLLYLIALALVLHRVALPPTVS